MFRIRHVGTYPACMHAGRPHESSQAAPPFLCANRLKRTFQRSCHGMVPHAETAAANAHLQRMEQLCGAIQQELSRRIATKYGACVNTEYIALSPEARCT